MRALCELIDTNEPGLGANRRVAKRDEKRGH